MALPKTRNKKESDAMHLSGVLAMWWRRLQVFLVVSVRLK
jgi:hypothetical protein